MLEPEIIGSSRSTTRASCAMVCMEKGIGCVLTEAELGAPGTFALYWIEANALPKKPSSPWQSRTGRPASENFAVGLNSTTLNPPARFLMSKMRLTRWRSAPRPT